MSTATVAIPAPPLFDETRLAVAGFLARYSGPTRTAETPAASVSTAAFCSPRRIGT